MVESPALERRTPKPEPCSGWVVIDPSWRERFGRRRLTSAGDFLGLQGDIISGHADRHVVRLVLGRGLGRTILFLKREHRSPWPVRLRNLVAGYGWVSKSVREASILNDLRKAGIRAPRALAFGEDGAGRAFVLIKETRGAIDLRTFLHEERAPDRRLRLARRMGRLLARIHGTGFNCPVLSSKHVIVRPRGPSPTVIDWHAASRFRRVGWGVRVRELALLHATVGDEVASRRERLACLRAYLRAAAGHRYKLRPWVRLIRRRAARLLRHRTVRDARRLPMGEAGRRLRWINGESLVVTRAVWRVCGGRAPAWLTVAARTPVRRTRETELRWGRRRVVLRQFPALRLVRQWWNRLRGRHEIAAGPRQAGRMFQLESGGHPAPQPLAFGQRSDGGSFIVFAPLRRSEPNV
jgi:tRNA A-37 threonylcarbamoyl transferase component Bud32